MLIVFSGKLNVSLCGCLYLHPNTDTAKFIEYIESTLTKIDKNKYAVFLMGH